MIRATTKKVLLAVLVAAFGIQTALVYTDTREDRLSEAALRGRSLWHEGSCQVCHQVYGQGGFLGPDLTNAAGRVSPERIRSLLTVGSGQMPVFGFSGDQIADLTAYLEALDRPDLGRGQLRLGIAVEAEGRWGGFGTVVAEALADSREAAAARGYAAFSAAPCMSCHLPLQDSPVGAPDLTEVAGRLSVEDLETVLTDGRPSLGMPPPTLSHEERADLIAFLAWMSDNRDALTSRMDEGPQARRRSLRSLPWWEFR